MPPARRLLSIAAVLAWLAVAAPAALAGTTIVPNTTDDPASNFANCTPPEPPAGCSLRGALMVSQDGDTVALGAGDYTLTRALNVIHAVTITGNGPASTTIDQTATNARVILLTATSIALDGLTISGGNLIGTSGTDGQGGLSAGSTAAAGSDGEAANGPALSTSGNAVTLTDVVVTGNTATGGDGGDGAKAISGIGGVGGKGGAAQGVISGASPLTLVRSAIVGNVMTAGHGGTGADGVGSGGQGANGGDGGSIFGGALAATEVTMTDSLVANNTQTPGTGGTGGAGSLSNSGGSGGNGGANSGGGLFFFAGGPLSFTNVTFAGNINHGSTGGTGGIGGPSFGHGGAGGTGSAGAGAGLTIAFGAAAQFDAVTFTGNQSGPGSAGPGGTPGAGGIAGTPGAVFGPFGNDVTMGGSATATLTIRDTIFAGAANDCDFSGDGQAAPQVTSLGHNLDEDATCLAAPAAGDLVNTPAGLAALADNGGPTETAALLPGSAAIGAGGSCVQTDGTTPLAADQRGVARPAPCDIGAFQTQPPPQLAPIGSSPPPVRINPCPICGLILPPRKLTGVKLASSSVHRGHSVKLTFTLDRAGRVSFKLRRKAAGVKVRGECVAPSKHRHGAACTRLLSAVGAPKAIEGTAGRNTVSWTPPKALAPGRYEVLATPEGGKSVTLDVTITR